MNEDTMTPEQLLAEAGRLAGLAAERSVRVSRDDLRDMSPEQIVAAHAAGRLDHLLRGEA